MGEVIYNGVLDKNFNIPAIVKKLNEVGKCVKVYSGPLGNPTILFSVGLNVVICINVVVDDNDSDSIDVNMGRRNNAYLHILVEGSEKGILSIKKQVLG